MKHIEFKHTSLTAPSKGRFREALPMIVLCAIALIGLVCTFAKAIG